MKKKLPFSIHFKWRFSKLLFTLLILCISRLGYAQIELVHDLNTTIDPEPTEFGSVGEANGTVFVAAANALWKTDGTQSGSHKIKTFHSLRYFVSYNNQLFFIANDGEHGEELWKSDGTTEGTVLVKDIFPGASSSGITAFVGSNNLLFFTATNGQHGIELWRTDGTPGGTFMLKDVMNGSRSSQPSAMVSFQNKLFFVASDGIVGFELWATNGTSNGTQLFKDLWAGKDSSAPRALTVVGTTLFFHAHNPTTGRELWKSDGTVQGTNLLKDIRPGSGNSNPVNFLNVKGTLYFAANDGVHGGEVWKSNGTAAGTVLAFELDQVAGSSAISMFSHGMITANGKIYLHQGDELYESDGTQAGTRYFRGEVGDFYNSVNFYIKNDVIYYFEMYERFNGERDVKSHRLVKIENSRYSIIKVLGDWEQEPRASFTSIGILFPYAVENGGTMLWKSDGTADGTVPFFNAIDHTLGSSPRSLVQLNGDILFRARGLDDVDWLYKMDGTTMAVERLLEETPFEITVSGIRAYFATDAMLWKTNGTPAGTMLVREFVSNENDLTPRNLVDVNGVLFFAGSDGNGGKELWKSTGNFAGTTRVKDIYPGGPGSHPSELYNFNGTLYFSAIHPNYGRSLWKSNGTDAGTVIVLPSDPAQSFSNPRGFAHVNNTLFFIADNPTTGTELYKTDGTPQGTMLVDDIRFGDSNYNDIRNLKSDGVRLYFLSGDGGGRWNVWTSDGTYTGTYKLADGPLYYTTTLLQAYRGKMYFSMAMSAEDGYLWTTNGTVEGTSILKRLPSGFGARTSAILDNILYFEGVGTNIWRTDGTECGTFMIESADGYNVSTYNNPQLVVNKDRRIIFAPYHPLTGEELYKLEKSKAPSSPCGTTMAAEEAAVVLEESRDAWSRNIVTSPNPFREALKLRVNSAEEKIYSASIITMNGNTVTALDELKTNVDYNVGSDLKSGLYLIKVQIDNRVEVRRVVKVD